MTHLTLGEQFDQHAENAVFLKELQTAYDDGLSEGTAERDRLKTNNAGLMAALGYVLDTMIGEWPDENDARGSNPRNPIWCREAKVKARVALAQQEQ